jgi:transposase
MRIAMLGVDLAKSIFHLYGVDELGRRVLSKRVSRAKLGAMITNLPLCVIGMEACSTSHHWVRRFEALGHEVRLIHPNFVRPYVKGNKNDELDAEAICEASSRPNMRFVPVKTVEQRDVQALHRARERLVRWRTALINQIHGIHGRAHRYLRNLLIHGGRAVLRFARGRTDPRSRWLSSLETRRGRNCAIVAQANKTARIARAVLARGEPFQVAA